MVKAVRAMHVTRLIITSNGERPEVRRDRLQHALAALDRARADADRQQIYIASFVPPSLPERHFIRGDGAPPNRGARRFRRLGDRRARRAVGAGSLLAPPRKNSVMAILPFRSALPRRSSGSRVQARGRAHGKARDHFHQQQLCGIAAYTDPLARNLNDFFEVTAFDLDQYLLRSSHASHQALG